MLEQPGNPSFGGREKVMSARLGRILRWSVGILLILAAVGLIGGFLLVRRSFPGHQGLVQVDGLDAAVEVYRSPDGVPSIYASTEHDLFFAQGYVHAQDRFWQMDFFRHVGAGRLAEMLGAEVVETDAFLRTLGWEQVALHEWDQADPQTRAVLQAYANGVNAYIGGRSATQLSLEHGLIGLLYPDYVIEPWTPVNSLTWAKSMAWDLGGNMDEEIDHALLLQSLAFDQVAALYPPYPAAHPVIVPSEGPAASNPIHATAAVPPGLIDDLASLRARRAEVAGLFGGRFPGIGSNSWVVGPERSASGGAMLANDTHLGIQMPSIWYENSLHCLTITEACRFDVSGFSFAGAPAVIIGHNARIAWGFTNADPDVQDLFIEHLNPANPQEYEVDGAWVTMDSREELIEVAGGDPVPLTVYSTRHGPLITDRYGALDDLQSNSAMELPEPFAIAMRWTALEPSQLFRAVLGLNLAGDWQAFRQALAYFDVPSQNVVYADVDGNIGYQLPGKIPVRAGGDGWLPVPGWTSEFEWTGYIPFEDLPNLYNPPQGYIVTANHAIVDRAYPHYLDRSWDYGFRADRIMSLLGPLEAVSAADMAAVQGDSLHPMAAPLTALLAALDYEDEALTAWAERLLLWDGQNDMDSAEAAVFNVVWFELLNRTFSAEWELGPVPRSSRAYVVMAGLLEEPQNPWWDIPATSQTETRDDILRAAFSAALVRLQASLGSDQDNWRWGRLHSATFRNQSLGESGIAPIEALFNRGPFEASGGESIVNATGWDPTEGFEVTSVPSERLIVDLADLDQTLTITTTGQSGHPFHPNYIDQADRWRLIEFHSSPFSLEAVLANAGSHLRLEPVGE